MSPIEIYMIGIFVGLISFFAGLITWSSMGWQDMTIPCMFLIFSWIGGFVISALRS